MITLITVSDSPRLRYTLNMVFTELSGVPCILTTDVQAKPEGPVLMYGVAPEPGYPWIGSAGLLFEDTVHDLIPGIFRRDNVPALFPVSGPPGSPGFDAFSAVFYMLSRYEEYSSEKRDSMGRFPATESYAYQQGFLEKAVVNHWVAEIQELIHRYYPDYQFKKSEYTFIPTIDIDIAFKYKYRSILRTGGAAAKSLLNGRFSEFGERISVCMNLKKDPFDTLGYISELHQQVNTNARYFFLFADYGDKDKGIPPGNPSFRTYIQEFCKNGQCGLHPSFASNADEQLLETEFRHFYEITGSPCIYSRQHFLKLSLPGTYQRLIRMGVQEDYSMGFADLPGFRAGIASPFYFYDLSKNSATQLKIWPITFMDGTLKDYMQLSDDQCLELAFRLTDEVKSAGGTLISLFHNESLSNTGRFKGWQSLYLQFLRYATT